MCMRPSTFAFLIWWRPEMHFAVFAVAAALLLLTPSIDAAAGAQGAAAAADTRAKIKALKDRNRREPSRSRAWEIVDLELEQAGIPSAAAQTVLTRFRVYEKKLTAEHQAILAGRIQDAAWLNSNWGSHLVKASDPDARELFRRVLADQHAPKLDYRDSWERQAFAPVYLYQKSILNQQNAAWLKAILDRIGWFDVRRYGPAASTAAWLIVQHADFDAAWQAAMIDRLRPKVATGDMQGSHFAYLVDRVALNHGSQQEYGTQGSCMPDGAWSPTDLRAPETVEDRRRSVGLNSLTEYASMFGCKPQTR
jgi:hypothetical protein